MRSFSAIIILFILLVTGIGTSDLHAQWVKDGVSITTHTSATSHCMIPDGSGGAIVAWLEGRYLHAQRIDIDGYVQWSTNGIIVCLENSDKYQMAMIPDGAGGAIITWVDDRLVSGDIYAQKIDGSGITQWSYSGVPVCTDSYEQWYPQIVSDGAGGAIITWTDSRYSDADIYAQRINSDGTAAWTGNGVSVCNATGEQDMATLIPDGAGGAIICWQDGRGVIYNDIYATRIDGYGVSVWMEIVISAASYDQENPSIVPDGTGGAIIAWTDYRGIFPRPYCQRITTLGTIQWTSGGIAACLAGFSLNDPSVAEDGSGGVLITWKDDRNSYPSVYAQRIDAAGTYLWTSDGALVCTGPGAKEYPKITTDGAGGAIVAWSDSRVSSTEIFAQILDSSAEMQLAPTGGAVCTADNIQDQPRIVSDGTGGAIIVWNDDRNSSTGLMAQRVDIDDGWYTSDPTIESVTDIPGDEGGYVRIKLNASIYDQPDAICLATNYNVWRRIESLTALNSLSSGDRDPVFESMDFLSQFSSINETEGLRVTGQLAAALGLPEGDWESLGQHAAMQDPVYYYVAATKSDSTTGGIPWETYTVTVHTTDPSFYICSEPDSGYSVDNLAPGMPVSLAGAPLSGPGGVVLTWDDNIEGDLAHYAVYRGDTEEFVPAPGNRIGSPTTSNCTDEYDLWHQSYYKVSAVDRHGNESSFALIGPAGITGDDPPTTPAAAYLSQNYPNPFNPMTTIRFGLSTESHVTLRIYDPSGRLVRELVNRTLPAGYYDEQWDGLTSSGMRAASGIYFYKLAAEEFVHTRKMVLLK